jgi:hypothetical protein
MHEAIDISGLSVDDAMKVAAREFLAEIVAGLTMFATAMAQSGLSLDEINPVLENERARLEEWRVKSLADLRAWLERGGVSLN